jgi:His/Glu/Gln/Arg/opine family amino acid ABC transporter permease subunit
VTTASEPRSTGAPTIVYEEKPSKAPPILVVGPLAWIRRNLFSTPMNTLLTLISGGLLVTVVTSFISWVVTQANWFVIIFNLRQFLLGRYEVEAEWRLQIMAVIIAFVIGVALAAWTRLSQFFAAAVALVVALTFILPAILNTIPLPPSYLVAGNVEIVSGASTQQPNAQIGFIGRAGEVISLQLAEPLTQSDAALQTLNSFADNGANLLRAAANNRLANEARIAEINALLEENAQRGPTLTANQVAALETELGRMEVPAPITETFRLNQAPVQLRLVRGTTGEAIGEVTLQPSPLEAADDPETDAPPPYQVTLPEDGWYILEQTVETDDSVALIQTQGIYPLLERSFSRSEVLDESGNVISSAGRYSQYVRMTDNFITEEVRPRIDGRDVPMTIIIDNQYRGATPLADYLRLYVGPFLGLINDGLLYMAVAGALGYLLTRFLDRTVRVRQQARNPRFVSQRLSTWMLAVLPFVMFILAYGIGTSFMPITDTRRWGGLLLTIMLTMVGIIASFPLGVLLALGRRSKLPVVSAACTGYIEFVRGVPLITVLFLAQLLVPLVNPSLAEVDNVFRAMVGITLFSAAYLAENVRGGLQSIPPGQEEAAKAVGLSTWQIILLITLPQALRAVIPALVGQFISLFKDTSLVAIVGLVDLTGISQATVAQTEFLGLRREVYIFITLIYFSFSYVMAAISRRIESSGSGAARRI